VLFRSALAAAIVGLALAYALAFLATNRAQAIADIDSTGFHLPVIARWIQTGSLWGSDDFVPGWGFGAYPHTGNVLQLVVLLPFHDDFLLRTVGPLFAVLAALGVYVLGAELGAPRPLALLFAAGAVMVPISAVVELNNGQTDLVAAAGFAVGAAFLARHARTGERSELALAGVGLALAFGTKWYGPPEAAAVLAVWVAGRALARQVSWRPALRDGVLVGLVTVLVGGFWLVRNWIVYADPVFPRPVAPLGINGAHAYAEHYDFSLAHYLTDFHLLRHGIYPQLVRTFGAPGLLIVLGTLWTVVVAWRRRAGAPLVLALAALAALVVYVVTPYTAQGPEGQPLVLAGARYALPGLMLGAGACAWLAGTLRRPGLVLSALVLPALLQAFHEDRTWDVAFRNTTLVRVVVAAVALGSLALAARRLGRWRPGGAAVAAGVVLLGLVVVVGGRKVQTTFDKNRYRVAATSSWIQTVPNRPIRIGIAGLPGKAVSYSVSFIAFGPRMRNHVSYIGPTRNHLLVDYRDRSAFTEALARGRYDVVLIGPPVHPSAPVLQWAQQAGWRPFVRDSRFTLLGPPKPS